MTINQRLQYDRIVAAAGIEPSDLSEQGQRILSWLSIWDEWTTGGLEEILGLVVAVARKDGR